MEIYFIFNHPIWDKFKRYFKILIRNIWKKLKTHLFNVQLGFEFVLQKDAKNLTGCLTNIKKNSEDFIN